MIWPASSGTVQADTPVISPNGDGRLEAVTIAGSFSAAMPWALQLLRGPETIRSVAGRGESFVHLWDGTVSGVPVPDGHYEWRVVAVGPDDLTLAFQGSIVVDREAPPILDVVVASATQRSADIDVVVAEDATVTVVIRKGKRVVRTIRNEARAGHPSCLVWDRRNGAGKRLPVGRYDLRVVAVDGARNRTATRVRSIRL